MQITVLPDAIGREKAAILTDAAIKQANYPDGDTRQEPVLRSLLRSWSHADCNFSAWRTAHPQLAKELTDLVHAWHVSFWPDSARALPIVSDSQRAGTEGHISTRLSGLRAFAWFLLIGAPHFQVGICDRCGNLYWNRSGHLNKRFCGRKCSRLQTATEAQERNQRRIRQEKITRLRRAIRWLTASGRPVRDWRTAVCRKAGVSKSFLTRALRRGERGEAEGLVLTKRQRRLFEERGKE